MTATGTSSPASLMVPSTLDGVAPSTSARRAASWITGPSMTGSEKGIPTSIASAPAPSSPCSSSASTPSSPPVTYGTKARPPASSRDRRAGSRSATRRPRARAQRDPHGLEVLVAPAGQVDKYERAPGERTPQEPADRMGRLERRQDPFQRRERGEALERLLVGDRDVGRAAAVLEERVLGAHAGVVQPRRDRVRRHHLPLLVLQEVGVRPVEHARLAQRERPAVLAEPVPPAAGFDADEPHARFGQECLEDADRVAPTADAGDHRVRVAPLALAELHPGLVADHALAIAHERGERMGSRDRAEDVVRVDHARRPVAQRLVERVLEGSASGGDRDDLGAEQLHPGDVRRLPDRVLLAHIDHARQPEERARRRRRDPVHPRAGLGDDPSLPEAPGEQHLAQRVVDLVRARVVQVLALEVNAVPGRLRQPRRERHRRRPAHEVAKQGVELAPEHRVPLERPPGRRELVERRDQHLGHVPAAVVAEPPSFVGERLERAHAAPRRVRIAAAGSGERISISPTRIAPAPASMARSTCSRPETPLSSTARRSEGTWGSRARARSTSSSSVSRSRAFTPITGASVASALARSSSVWVSTSAPSPRSAATASIPFSSSSDRAAAINRTASLPAARDSITCAGCTRKSFRTTGTPTASRTARMSASAPSNHVGSVSTEIAAAPPSSYARAWLPTSVSAIAPADGDARLYSAITAGTAVPRSAPSNARGGGRCIASAIRADSSSGSRSRRRRSSSTRSVRKPMGPQVYAGRGRHPTSGDGRDRGPEVEPLV